MCRPDARSSYMSVISRANTGASAGPQYKEKPKGQSLDKAKDEPKKSNAGPKEKPKDQPIDKAKDKPKK
jgi:hypothetical protein